jgi:Flp pilus assembly protein TadD
LRPEIPVESKAAQQPGDCTCRAGQAEDAISHFSKALEIKPDFAKAHYNLGVVYRSKGVYDLAFKEMRIAESLGLGQQLRKTGKGKRGEMPSIPGHP